MAGGFVWADQEATTKEGQRVLLRDDGQWEYIREKPKKEEDRFDFRGVNWGLTRAEVRLTESGKPSREGTTGLFYSSTVAGMPVIIAYVFDDQRLSRARYIFQPKHEDTNDYLVDFKDVKVSLLLKYGQPKIDEVDWRNKEYKDEVSKWGTAVSLGHLTYRTSWETPTTNILLTLRGDNYKVSLETEYSAK